MSLTQNCTLNDFIQNKFSYFLDLNILLQVDEIITQNKTSLSVLDSLFESEAEVVEEDDSSSEKDSSSDDEMAAVKTAAVIESVLAS